MRVRGQCLLVGLFLAGGALAQETDSRSSKYERFQLYSGCSPMFLSAVVEEKDAAATTIGLTQQAIEAAVESRLRSARLYDAKASQMLSVNVIVVGSAFSVSMDYYKVLLDPLSQEKGPAPTWSSNWVGTHGQRGGYILSWVSQNMDQFLVEYLRVNEAACKGR